MGKAKVVSTRQVEHVRNERSLLEFVNFPFIIKMYASFQDTRNIYLGMVCKAAYRPFL